MADNKAADTVWFVRGVAVTLRADVAEAAKREGMKIGPWVERALRTALAASEISVTDPMADLMRRLQAVEAKLAKLGQGEAVTVEGGGEVSAAPETRAAESADGKRRRARWTAADDQRLKRISADGGNQADAMRELQRSSGTINAKWKSLGLPVQPRAGRKLGPRSKRTA